MDLTLYAVLGAPAQASQDQLEQAYEERLAALDREADAAGTDAARRSVHDARARLEEAWEILGDPKLRMQYDLRTAMEHAPSPAPGGEAPPGPPALHHDQPPAPTRTQDADGLAPMHHLPPPPAGAPSDPADTRRAPARTECQLCGSAPAARVTLRREVGMILVRQSHVLEGTYCRSCGLSLFRDMTDKTLVRGWWGFISFFVNGFTIARNLAARVTIGRLGPPVPNPEVRAPIPRPLDPGRSAWLRLGALVVAALVVGVIVLIALDDGPDPVPDDAVGTCLALSDDLEQIEDEVPCSGDEDAVIVSVVSADEPCPSGEVRFEGGDEAICLVLR